MIKLYLDWGVMSQMKQGIHADLAAILLKKEQFFIVYSTSHISDILVSHTGTEEQDQLIKKDLSYLSTLTDNYCAHIENNQISINQLDPNALFEERVWQKKAYGGEGLFDFVLKECKQDLEIYQALKAFLNSPIPYEISQALNDPLIADKMKIQYPGLEENPTMENLINIGWKKVRALNETEAYSELRKTLQQGLGINRDQIFATSDPYTFINQVYQKLAKKAGISIDLPLPKNLNCPEWFNTITENYLKLDMHGYQEDKVKVADGSRKETMRNTVDDGFHAAFSSMCDFYIVDDKKSRAKTKEVFKQLELNTKVLSAQEFVLKYIAYLKYDNISVHRQLWFEILQSKDFTVSQEDGGTLLSYYMDYFIFDYFNRCLVYTRPDYLVPVIFLSKDKPTNNKFIYRNELTELITKLSLAFETNISTPEHVSPEKLSADNWLDYKWNWGGCPFRLVQREGYLQPLHGFK